MDSDGNLGAARRLIPHADDDLIFGLGDLCDPVSVQIAKATIGPKLFISWTDGACDSNRVYLAGQDAESERNLIRSCTDAKAVDRAKGGVLFSVNMAEFGQPAGGTRPGVAGLAAVDQIANARSIRRQQDSSDACETRLRPRTLQLASGLTVTLLHQSWDALAGAPRASADESSTRIRREITAAVAALAAKNELQALCLVWCGGAASGKRGWLDFAMPHQFDIVGVVAPPGDLAVDRASQLIEPKPIVNSESALAPKPGMAQHALALRASEHSVEAKLLPGRGEVGRGTEVIRVISPDKPLAPAGMAQSLARPSTLPRGKPNRKKVTLELRESVVRLDDVSQSQEAAALLERKSATQVFLVVAQKPASKVLEEAMGLACVLDKVRGLVKPIVVGPLEKLTPEMDRRFAKRLIRTTGFTFDEYVKDIKEHCEFVDKVRSDHEQRRRVS